MIKDKFLVLHFVLRMFWFKRILSSADLLKWITSSIPKLESKGHKGQAGKICIVGGSKEYTGAPYFSAISALYCGADLVHVICPEEAASVIKSYSPELIVHPILNKNKEECYRWLTRMNAVVLGPGLGRYNVNDSVELIKFIREQNVPLVIDADGLHLVSQYKSLISGYNRVVLSPNVVESKMLFKTLLNEDSTSLDQESCTKLASSLNNVTIVMKGASDIITDGIREAVCDSLGSPRRCGGQGDVLGGITAVMLNWCLTSDVFSHLNDNEGCELITATYGACVLTRRCAESAFAEKKRAMTTTDMISKIGQSFQELFQV